MNAMQRDANATQRTVLVGVLHLRPEQVLALHLLALVPRDGRLDKVVEFRVGRLLGPPLLEVHLHLVIPHGQGASRRASLCLVGLLACGWEEGI